MNKIVCWPIALFLFATSLHAVPFIYVASQGGARIDIVELATNTIPVSITDASIHEPVDVVLDPVQNRAYVVNNVSGEVSVIDTDLNYVIDTITVGMSPQAMAILPDGSRGYVSNSGDGTV